MIAPKTVPIPAAVPFRLGRTPVTNRDYAPFLALGRVPEPPWWRDARFSAAALPVVGVSWEDAMAFCALGRRERRRNVAAADRGRVGARRLWRADVARDGVGRRGSARRDPRRAPRRSLGDRPRHSQRLRSLRHGDDRPRVVPELARAARAAAPCGAPGEPGRFVAPRDPLVASIGLQQPAARLPLLRLRLPRSRGRRVTSTCSGSR